MPRPGLATVAVPVPLLGPFCSDRMDFTSVEVAFVLVFEVWIRMPMEPFRTLKSSM